MGSYCANAQTPAYTVQIVPDPPVPAGFPHPQRDPNLVLPDGRFVISHGYDNGAPGQQFIGNENGWATPTPLPGYDRAWISDVAANGDMLGSSINAPDTSRPTLWQGGQAIDLAPQLVPGALVSAMNASGTITGIVPTSGDSTYQPFTWSGGATTLLSVPQGYTTASAVATNIHGLTIGTAGSEAPRPVVWDLGVPTMLPVPEGDLWSVWMGGVNDSGWVVAHLLYHNGPSGTYLWRNGERELLEEFWFPWPPMVSNTGDVLINDELGPCVWRDGTIYRMGDLQTPGFDGQVEWLHKMLNDGRVLGWVSVDGVMHNAVFTPIPAPATLSLMAFVALVSHRRRRSAPRVHHL